MKQTIRQGTFETNSSSTHTLSIYNTEQWTKFKNGELYIDTYNDTLISEDEMLERYEAEVTEKESYPIEDWMLDNGIYIYDSYTASYEVLTEDIKDAGVTAVSIFGYE
jgi:hypothetical protein